MRFLHLATLSTLVISQPIYNLLADNPQFFLVRGATLSTLLVFLLLTFFSVPVLLSVFVLICRLVHARAGQIAYGFVFTLIVLFGAFQIANRIPALSDSAIYLVAIGIAGIASAAYFRSGFVQSVLSAMSVAIILVPMLFLNYYWDSVYRKELSTTESPLVRSPHPLDIVIFDELPLSVLLDRHGNIDKRRFPNFSELASNSTWYPNASTVSDNTSLAIPAMLSSALPNLEGLSCPPSPTFAEFPRNIFSLLRGSHRMQVHESVSRLCPSNLCQRQAAAEASELGSWRVITQDTAIVFLHLLLPKS